MEGTFMNRFSDLPDLLAAIEALRVKQEEYENQNTAQIAPFDSAASSRNLLHYVAMRREDLRPIQGALISRGLTSLGGAEGSAQFLVQALSRTLHMLAGRPVPEYPEPPSDPAKATGLLDLRTEALLGQSSGKRQTRIMVTMPSEAATDPQLISNLLEAGMDVMRINCAHDGPDEWAAMAGHLAAATRQLGRPCKVYTDLAGPKLRTGDIEAAGQLLKLRPRRSPTGEVMDPVRFWFAERAVIDQPDALPRATVLAVNEGSLAEAANAKYISLRDSRGSGRQLQIIERQPGAILLECDQTLYLETGGSFYLCDESDSRLQRGSLGSLPDLVLPIIVHTGDRLVVTGEGEVGRHAAFDDDGMTRSPARIPCTLPEVFGAVQVGQPVFFDDGKIGGVIDECSGETFTVRITRAAPGGSKLRSGKGINLPDTNLPVSPLTVKDRDDLRHVARFADIVGLSFVRTGSDVTELQRLLAELKREDCGIVAKIETQAAFQNIVTVLLAGLRCPSFGVMIARGDLAVELGFERLSEAQEEIVWMCEAAHVPVIWATQILETLAKAGLPTRAEVTDAASAVKAECAMLNKGPHILEAVRFLSGLLERGGENHSKKHNLLRKLSIARID
jgi:pyruvate kinase